MLQLTVAEIAAGLRRLSASLLRAAAVRGAETSVPVWEILTRTTDENTHSSVLRWLFDPRGSHGLGSEFLMEFYRRVFGHPPPDTDSVRARCETQSGGERADLIVCGRSWRLVIENKIKDRNDRTLDYAKRWPGSDFVFLTTSGRRARSKKFRRVPYRVVREILDGLQPRGEAAAFIKAFAKHIASDLEEN